jgi:hypothetical protein
MRHRRPEDAIQRALFQHIRLRGVAGLVAIHVPNGGFRRPIEAKILAGLGVTKGVPDVLLWHDGKSYAIELKSEDGKATSSQIEMLNRLGEAGVATAVCHGIDQAVTCLESWRLLRGKCSDRAATLACP